MSAGRLRRTFSPEARSDLRDVLAYTEQQWGKAQRRVYKQILYDAFEHLARFPEMGRARPEYGAAIRSHQIRQHVVIYRATDTELIIVRILHVRRDIDSELGVP